MTKIGAHLSIAGGYHQALLRIATIGGNCLQIFSSPPRGWHLATVLPEEKQLFIDTKKKLGIDPVFFHATYLINLADSREIGTKSIQSLTAELGIASQLGVTGSIVHTGSFKKNPPAVWDVSEDKTYSVLINNILTILTQTPKDTFLIIENAGNRKIGQSLDEIHHIVKDVNDERLKVCLDSCHLFSAGYDISSPEKLNVFLTEFDKKIGIEKIVVWHLNDSRDPFDSGHDRHENIGQGSLGVEPFRHIINHPRLRHLPFIIETPGFDGNGPDKKNIDILKSLVTV